MSRALQFLRALPGAVSRVQVTDRTGAASSLETALAMLETCRTAAGRVYFIGNGGSAAIASHQAVDYWKLGGLDATAFNDSSMLTAVGNDDGFEQIFARPIASRARPGDLLVAVSSSGRSPDILAGARAARERGAGILTFSGFEPSNPLRALGDVNFYVPESSYGLVEITHLSLLHAMCESLGATS